ncbi:MAG: hypothetical protein GEV08_05940 [Acidimicrobiia bacterium]|nr:hypothetical protein [Acidimicrobiia bacterium]
MLAHLAHSHAPGGHTGNRQAGRLAPSPETTRLPPSPRGRGRGRGRGGGPGRGRGRGGDDLVVFGDDGLLTAHVVLGVTIIVLAAVRLYWRRRTARARLR